MNEIRPVPAALANAAVTASACTELSPGGRAPETSAAGRPGPVAGAAATVATASTAVATNAQRQPNGIATAGSARPASSDPTGAPACIAPKARPWRDSGTCWSTIPLAAGDVIALPTPPS